MTLAGLSSLTKSSCAVSLAGLFGCHIQLGLKDGLEWTVTLDRMRNKQPHL
jgi:hypothetical protein